MKEKHFWLYVLKLEQGKYYVGITSQTPEKRFAEHLSSRKTYWTEKYKPTEIFDKKYLGDLDEEEAKAYENKITRVYMKKYGVNNVRGGDITTTNDMVVRFGYIFDKFGWQAITTVCFLLLVILILAIKDWK